MHRLRDIERRARNGTTHPEQAADDLAALEDIAADGDAPAAERARAIAQRIRRDLSVAAT